ncbi:hypothetical protein ACFFLM_05680 [Deinococcus oregonensis]|uniref:Uncharacterized protein n=1 Tax=Deinococcus oregonensis TaxID=1805970 RepID=A0ABV6AVC4_9DEIO
MTNSRHAVRALPQDPADPPAAPPRRNPLRMPDPIHTEALDLGVPHLLLGVRTREWQQAAAPQPQRKWRTYHHVCGGAQEQLRRLVGFELPLHAGLARRIQDFQKSLPSDAGHAGMRLSDVRRYQDLLRSQLQLDCEESYLSYTHAVYPVDCRADFFARLTPDALPTQLDALLYDLTDPQKRPLDPGVQRWQLWIVTSNAPTYG